MASITYKGNNSGWYEDKDNRERFFIHNILRLYENLQKTPIIQEKSVKMYNREIELQKEKKILK